MTLQGATLEDGTVRRTAGRNSRRCSLLIAGLFAICCGGKSKSEKSAGSGSVNGAGATTNASGGDAVGGTSESSGSGASSRTSAGALGGTLTAGAGADISSAGSITTPGGGSAGQSSPAGGQGGSAGDLAQAGGMCCPIVIAGAGGDDGVCDTSTLWRAIGTAGGYLSCQQASPDLAPTEHLGPGRGAVVLDADGRVIDNTGLGGAAKQDWLKGLASQRWPCLAGQTVGYSCSSHD